MDNLLCEACVAGGIVSVLGFIVLCYAECTVNKHDMDNWRQSLKRWWLKFKWRWL